MKIKIPKLENAGAAIKQMRLDAGWSQKDLAEALEWDYTRISKYENNKLALSQEVIEAISEKLGISPVVVILKCLQVRYPALADPKSKLHKLIEGVIREVS